MSLLAQQFPILQQEGVYLNHAAMSPWPAQAAQAVKAFVDENLHHGARHYSRWMSVEKELHSKLAELINAPSAQDIALCKNTSEGLSLVANGLNWQQGDEVVIPNIEFPSNRLPWIAQQGSGVRVIEVDINTDNPEDSLISACGPHTRLLSVSAVQYGDGLRLDLEKLGRFCRENHILFCVDAIQQLGAIPMDVNEIQCDFLIADAHKWLLGPEGIAVFYSQPEARQQLKSLQQGWRIYDDPFNFERKDWTEPESARRFEIGSPNMIGIFAFNACVDVLLSQGMSQVGERVLANSATLATGIQSIPGLQLLSRVSEHRRSGIISFTSGSLAENQRIHHQLLELNVVGACRGNGIRWSPHFYQSDSDMAYALEQLTKCVSRKAS